ncbi:hypothetical protein N182_26335 [Sinorhizobium sp. GL2]|nr:hypothetical protein N182_26335 [Sinorhizobium sp. GL2]
MTIAPYATSNDSAWMACNGEATFSIAWHCAGAAVVRLLRHGCAL